MFFITAKAHERVSKFHKEAEIARINTSSRRKIATFIRQIAKRIDSKAKGGSYVRSRTQL